MTPYQPDPDRLLIEIQGRARKLRVERGADPEDPPLQAAELVTAAGALREESAGEASAIADLIVAQVRSARDAGLTSPSVVAGAKAAGLSRETFYARMAAQS